MSRLTLLLASQFICFSSLAQKSFNKGYFIDNEGKKTEAFISDKDWTQDAKTFRFRNVEQGDGNALNISDVKDIGVGEARYLRADVEIDKSSGKPQHLSQNRSPEWERHTVFLSVLVDGKADLFYCEWNGEKRFFYRVDDRPIVQLEHKLYQTAKTETAASRVLTNNAFKNQLKNDVNCAGYSDGRLSTLHYEIAVLTKFFKQQNECWGEEETLVSTKDYRNLRLRIAPGVSYAEANGEIIGDRTRQEYEPGIGYRFGAEFEYMLPFNRKKWAVLIEPAWQQFKSELAGVERESLSYNSVELATGVRHYFFLGKEGNIFVNGAALFDFPIEYIMISRSLAYRAEKSSVSLAAGIGGSYKRFSLEARYYSSRTTTGTASVQVNNQGQIIGLKTSTDYQKFSLILSYRIL